jgi:DNA invertase Pin-like site-specific DNA recombinase
LELTEAQIHQNRLLKLAREGGQMTAQHLRDLETTRRYATLVAVVLEAKATIIDGTPSGRFFFHVMASLAQMERELIVERTCTGLDVARRLGRTGGRKRRMTDSKIQSARKLLASGTPPKEVAKNLGVSVPTLYRWIPASTPA